MPVITLFSNIPKDAENDKKIALGLAELVPACFNKASDRAQIIINSGVTMTMGGSDDPCACLKIVSIGAVTPEMNKNTCTLMTEYLAANCKIDPGRIFIDMNDIHPTMIGKGGKMFDEILTTLKNLVRLF